MTTSGELWTINELGGQVALALATAYDGAPNGRVRAIPDLRTIRYYTTLGLLDRPAQLRGRTALYGRRHLLQLVAIKRLQARGLALTAIQQQLLGQTDSSLEAIAQVPADACRVVGAEPAPEEPRAEFWKAEPTAPEPPGEQTPLEIAAVETVPAPLQGVPLGEDVLLLFAPARPLEPDDLEALRTVAAPLLKLLHARRLHHSRHERDPR